MEQAVHEWTRRAALQESARWAPEYLRSLPHAFAAVAAAGFLVFCAGTAAAGPTEGGTLILHANPDLVYSPSLEYCGSSGIESCAEALTRVPADPDAYTVFFALAAFPSASSPSLTGVTFGVQYDAQELLVADTGSCGEFEIHTDDWPQPGSGTAMTWFTPQRQHLVELQWFSAYVLSDAASTTFDLSEHPTQGGLFGSDGHGHLDEIADYGRLGFGADGYLPCPDGPVPTVESSWGSVKGVFRVSA